MIGPNIERPFGEDEDANRAARSVMSVVSELSVQSRRLAQTSFRNVNAMHAQRQLVRELHERVESAARRVHVAADDMLEAAKRLLEKRAGRKIVIHAPPTCRPGLDEQQRQLDGAVLDAEQQLERARETLQRVATRVKNLELLLEQRRADARVHRLAQLGRAA